MSRPIEEDDASLVSRCLRGEAPAWAALVHRYQRLVYVIARRAGLDEHGVADVFQGVFARLVENLPRIRHAERLHAWIVTTAKREALSQRRRAQRVVSLTRGGDDPDDETQWDVADDALLPDEALIELERLDLLRRALERLDGRCRELLSLLFADPGDAVPYEEVARRLAMPVGSIGPTRARCLDKLRAIAARCISGA